MPTDEIAEQQLVALGRARQLRGEVAERLPHRVVGRAADEKNHVGVWRESAGHLSMSVVPHAASPCEVLIDVNFYDTWRADVALKVEGLGTGFLPLLALMRDPDLVPAYLPYVSGLPNIESLVIANEFGGNDWIYHCFVTPFGPLPGADDVHNVSLFDCLDVEGEEGVVFYAISPTEGESSYRGWPVPPVKGWRRKRNYVYGASCLIRPSAIAPLELAPPSERPARCATPGCGYLAHSCLSVGGGRYCCQRCQDRGKPGKYDGFCEHVPAAEEDGDGANGGGGAGGGARAGGGGGGGGSKEKDPTPREAAAMAAAMAAAAERRWCLPTHGTVDLELCVNVKLPIPTFLIPLFFLRWLVPKLLRVIYPLLLLLNERFERTPFAPRVAADGHGFYKAVADTINAPGRRCAAREPRFVI